MLDAETRLSKRIGRHRQIQWWAVGAVLLVIGGLSAAAPSDQNDREPWTIPSFKANKKNPVAFSAASIDKGAALYRTNCQPCHDTDGEGDGAAASSLQVSPRDLTRPEMWLQPDGELFWKITTGRPPMPAWADVLDEEQRWHIVNYMRTLAPSPDPPTFDVSRNVRDALSEIVAAYRSVAEPLAEDDAAIARLELSALEASIDGLPADTSDLSAAARQRWTDATGRLRKAVGRVESASDLQGLRSGFNQVSIALRALVEQFGHTGDRPLIAMKCSKALGGRGGLWLETGPPTRNPYDITSAEACERLDGLYAPSASAAVARLSDAR